MDTFEFDSDAFYICTEISPRNFVVQKAIQIDKNQIERMVGKLDGKTEKAPSPDSSAGTSSAHSPGTSSSTSVSGVGGFPQPPPFPYWFSRECKSTLMMHGPPPPHAQMDGLPPSSAPNQYFPVPVITSREEFKKQLRTQLEYYFSRENLISDKFLKCQMDEEQFVPITVVASFPKVAKLTNDIDLIVEALKESAILELDKNSEKVRAITKRTTIIVREIPEEHREVVVKLLENGPPFVELSYAHNDSWYVTYKDELETQCAYISVQNRKNEITQRPVCVRMKAGGAPAISSTTDIPTNGTNRLPVTNNGERGTIQVADTGQTLGLAELGLVPIATYRPGEPIMSHYSTPTCQFSVNSYGYNTSMSSQSPQPLLSQQPQLYYSPSVSSTNFDTMSTTSSTSTRTSASNYNSRSNSNRNGGGGNHYEQRNSFSNDWKSRNSSSGNGGRFQSNHNQNQNETRLNNGSGGNWRNGSRNGSNTNGFHQRNNRQNGQQNNWRNEQSSHSASSNAWLTSKVPSIQTRHTYENGYANRRREPASPSSSSSTSSKKHSIDTFHSQANSEKSTSPPLVSSDKSQEYSVPTPTDLPPPPVWPAPNFDRRRKSSEASSTTVTTNTSTNTMTPSTPVTSSDIKSTLIQETTTKMVQELNLNEKSTKKKEESDDNGHIDNHVDEVLKVETKVCPVVEKEKVKSPPAVPIASPPLTVVAAPLFAFEENAFPSLPKKIEPVQPPKKPTFSSVAAGRLVKQIRQMPSEKKTSYAEKLKQHETLLRK